MADGFVLSPNSHGIFYLWFCVGEYDLHALSVHVYSEQIPAYLNKHIQTNVIYLETGLDSQRGRVFVLVFTVSTSR